MPCRKRTPILTRCYFCLVGYWIHNMWLRSDSLSLEMDNSMNNNGCGRSHQHHASIQTVRRWWMPPCPKPGYCFVSHAVRTRWRMPQMTMNDDSAVMDGPSSLLLPQLSAAALVLLRWNGSWWDVNSIDGTAVRAVVYLLKISRRVGIMVFVWDWEVWICRRRPRRVPRCWYLPR